MRWNEFERLVATVEQSRLKAVLEEVNGDLLKSLVDGHPHGRADVFPLCRLVTFMGLVKSPARRRKGEDEEKPIPIAWTEIYSDINNFVESVCPPPLGGKHRPLLHKNFDDKKIKAFASLGHPKRGQTEQNFYVTILIYLYHQWCLGNFETKPFRNLAARSDRNIPVQAVKSIAASLQHHVPFAGEPDSRQVLVPFGVLEENESKFRAYFDEFSVPKRPRQIDDREPADNNESPVWQLQFIVYRPMATNASRIMRSFLSVYFRPSPGGFSSDLNFTHWVQPPSHGQKAKIATGKVVPLVKAPYLIGGQRSEARRENRPYDTVKAMALDPHSIDRLHPVVPMVALSSRNDGRPIISRALARVTPFDYAAMADLTPVELQDLETSLLAECQSERKYLDGHPLRSHFDERKLDGFPLPLLSSSDKLDVSGDDQARIAQDRIFSVAKQIRMKITNTPDPNSGVAVPPGYSSKVRPLSSKELSAAIEHMLAEYPSEDGQIHDFWADTLFGPLTLGNH